MNFSDTFDLLAAAMVKAQGSFTSIPRGRRNQQTNKDYATLDDLFTMIRTPLSEAGLSYLQSPRLEISDANRPPVLVMVTRILHASGQWVEGEYPVPIKPLAFKGAGEDAQAYGSAGTYGRKYGLMAILGIAPGDETDDDGNAASGRGSTESANAGSAESALRAAPRPERAAPSSPTANAASAACPECHAPAGKPHTADCKAGQSRRIATETGDTGPTRTQATREFQSLPNMPTEKEIPRVFESCLKTADIKWDWESPTIVANLQEATRIFRARNEAREGLVEVARRTYGEPVTDEVLRGILDSAGITVPGDLWAVTKKKWATAAAFLETRNAMTQEQVEEHGRPGEEEDEGPLPVPPLAHAPY
jgi:hypothetical protein